jgi:hypothetical protein
MTKIKKIYQSVLKWLRGAKEIKISNHDYPYTDVFNTPFRVVQNTQVNDHTWDVFEQRTDKNEHYCVGYDEFVADIDEDTEAKAVIAWQERQLQRYQQKMAYVRQLLGDICVREDEVNTKMSGLVQEIK